MVYLFREKGGKHRQQSSRRDRKQGDIYKEAPRNLGARGKTEYHLKEKEGKRDRARVNNAVYRQLARVLIAGAAAFGCSAVISAVIWIIIHFFPLPQLRTYL